MSWFKLGGRKDPEDSDNAAEASAAPGPATPASDAQEAAVDLPEKPPQELADFFLTMEEHLNPVELEDMTKIVSELRQPPPIVDRLTVGLDDPDELKEAILSSPTLSADVLRVVNSAAFALTSPISSIEHAVTYLGANTVKGLVMQAAVAQLMIFTTDVQKAAYMRVWRASYAASALAQSYAQALKLEHPSVYATRALLCNIGDLALISVKPELSAIYAPRATLLSRLEAQQQELVANSAVLASILARNWNLPDDLCDAMRHALFPLVTDPAQSHRSIEQQRDDTLLYVACRFGDAVAFSGLREIEDFELDPESVEFFYARRYIEALSLQPMLEVTRDRKTGRRVQHLINSFTA